MIDRVYQTVKSIENTDGRGNISPKDFNLFLYNVISEKFEEYIYEINRAVNRQNKGLTGNTIENLPERIREKMEHFRTQSTLFYEYGLFPLPTNLRYIDSVFYYREETLSEITHCNNAAEFNALSMSKRVKPSEDYPIYLKMVGSLWVRPATIINDISIHYLRNPKIPKWTYTVLNGTELFNPSASDFQDVDMHPSEEDDIVSRLLIKMGINLKEPDLQAAEVNKKTQEFNQQNMI